MNVPAICAEGNIMTLSSTIFDELNHFLSWAGVTSSPIDALGALSAIRQADWATYYPVSVSITEPPLGGSTFHLGTLAADTFLFTDEAFTVDAGDGANVVHGGFGSNFVRTGIGADTVILTVGNNVILSEAGANTINVTTGNNVISTGLGADSITATSGNNFIDAGDGANTITVSSGNNTITTGSGADNITTAGFSEILDDEGNIIPGFEGSVNTIDAGDGANTITTGGGKDTITGGNNADTITSGAGDDIIDAKNGANTITTGAGNDIVKTGLDVDTVSAGVGDDIIYVYGGTDTISAGSGNDTLIVEYGDAVAAVSVNSLSGNLENGYSGNVSGLGAATFLGVENFHITSGEFNDVITTGGGDDIINTGAGNDKMTGGYGADRFVFVGGVGGDGFGDDIITDFKANGDLDQIDLSNVAGLGDVGGFTIADFMSNIVYNSATSSNPSNAVISAGSGNTITLTNVVDGDLVDTDFIF
jgi:Ca2+-binding RTX toxin-like protein